MSPTSVRATTTRCQGPAKAGFRRAPTPTSPIRSRRCPGVFAAAEACSSRRPRVADQLRSIKAEHASSTGRRPRPEPGRPSRPQERDGQGGPRDGTRSGCGRARARARRAPPRLDGRAVGRSRAPRRAQADHRRADRRSPSAPPGRRVPGSATPAARVLGALTAVDEIVGRSAQRQLAHACLEWPMTSFACTPRWLFLSTLAASATAAAAWQRRPAARWQRAGGSGGAARPASAAQAAARGRRRR